MINEDKSGLIAYSHARQNGAVGNFSDLAVDGCHVGVTNGSYDVLSLIM